MKSTLSNILSPLLASVDAVSELWELAFRTSLHKTWRDPTATILEVIVRAQEHLSLGDARRGQVSFFLREPLSDRLVLELCTDDRLSRGHERPSAVFFRDVSANYDEQNNVLYYQLCDRLCDDDEKKMATSADSRGLTGWVAVTGHALRLNSEKAAQLLDAITVERPEVTTEVGIYGKPQWSRRISEIPDENNGEWNKRLLAVPVKSAINRDATIGVLRYSCAIGTRELTAVDQVFLEAVGTIISSLENVRRAKPLVDREDRAALELGRLQSGGDVHQFLRFVAEATSSRIASLYVLATIKGEKVLRLVDAYGIGGSVCDLRDQLRDYPGSQDCPGLTWAIFRNPCGKPLITTSVVQEECWAGHNTGVFYDQLLRQLGLAKVLGADPRKVLTHYTIKLMGIPICYAGTPIGVLKVEFPTSFDSSQQYKNDEDKNFVSALAHELGAELHRYQSFVDGRWFEGASEKNVAEFVRLLGLVTRVQLVRPEESSEFFSAIAEFTKKYRPAIEAEISARGRLYVVRQPDDFERLLTGLKSRLPDIVFEIIRLVLRVSM